MVSACRNDSRVCDIRQWPETKWGRLQTAIFDHGAGRIGEFAPTIRCFGMREAEFRPGQNSAPIMVKAMDESLPRQWEVQRRPGSCHTYRKSCSRLTSDGHRRGGLENVSEDVVERASPDVGVEDLDLDVAAVARVDDCTCQSPEVDVSLAG